MQMQKENLALNKTLKYSAALLAGALSAYIVNDAESDLQKEMLLVQIQAEAQAQGGFHPSYYGGIDNDPYAFNDNWNVYLNNHAPDPHSPPFWQNYGKYIVPNNNYNNYGHHGGYNSPHGYHGNNKVTFNRPRTNQLTFNKYQYGHIELAVNTDSDSALTSDGLSDSSTSDLFDHFHPGNFLHGKNTVGFVNQPCNNGCGYSNYNNCNSCNYNNNYNNN